MCCLSGNGHLRRQWSFKVSDITRKIYNCNINCIRCSQHEPRGLAKFCFRQLLCVSLITLLLLLPSPRSFKETQFSSLCQLASDRSLLQVCYLKLQRDPVAERAAAATLVQGHRGAVAPPGDMRTLLTTQAGLQGRKHNPPAPTWTHAWIPREKGVATQMRISHCRCSAILSKK